MFNLVEVIGYKKIVIKMSTIINVANIYVCWDKYWMSIPNKFNPINIRSTVKTRKFLSDKSLSLERILSKILLMKFITINQTYAF